MKEDIPAALLYITNWGYIVREIPYFEAFGRPPLLQQFWSLAVEEQFYNKLNEFQPFLYRGGILITAIGSALLIIGVSSRTTLLGNFLETPPLRGIGARSHSLYLWHLSVFMLTRPTFDVQLLG